MSKKHTVERNHSLQNPLTAKLKDARQIITNRGVPEFCREAFDYLLTPIATIAYKYRLGIDTQAALEIHRGGERPMLLAILEELQSDDVFWDIGASNGVYALKAAQIIPPKNILAIDPGNGILELAKRTSNGMHVEHAAIDTGDIDDVLIPNIGLSSDDPVKTLTAQDLLDNYPPPTVIKIDTMGWEWRVLEALRPALETCRLIVIDCEPPDANNRHRHPDLHQLGDEVGVYFDQRWSFDGIIELLVSEGFDLEYLMDNTGDLFIKAVK